MRKTPIWAALDNGIIRLEINVSMSNIDTPYFIDENSIKGFWSTPAIKTALTESQIRNGSHGISHRVLYSSRVVTIPFAVKAANRSELNEAKTNLSLLVGSPNVRFEVYNGPNESTFVEGMIAIEYRLDIDERTGSGEITLTCVDAERKSVNEYSQTLGFAFSSDGSGLFFGKEKKGLVFPLNFGKKTKTGANNSTILYNNGSYESDIVIEANGSINGLIIQWQTSNGNNGTLEYVGYISAGQIVRFDSKTESATVSGSDFSDLLVYRQFPKIPAKGNTRILAIPITSDGNTGFVNVKYRDTWM